MVEKQFSQAEIELDNAYPSMIEYMDDETFPDNLHDAFIYSEKSIINRILYLHVRVSNLTQKPQPKHYYILMWEENKKILLEAINKTTNRLYGRSLIDSIVPSISYAESPNILDYVDMLE